MSLPPPHATAAMTRTTLACLKMDCQMERLPSMDAARIGLVGKGNELGERQAQSPGTKKKGFSIGMAKIGPSRFSRILTVSRPSLILDIYLAVVRIQHS